MLWPMKANNLKRKISRRWLSSPCILEWLISGAFCELKFFKFVTKCQNILRHSFAIMRQVLQFSPPSLWPEPHLAFFLICPDPTLWLCDCKCTTMCDGLNFILNVSFVQNSIWLKNYRCSSSNLPHLSL